MYHHMNNSVYYYLYIYIYIYLLSTLHFLMTTRFDSVVNTYLIQHCSLHPPTSPQIGLVVHSHCDYLAPVGFPAVVDLALRVNKLGKSSVTYEIAVFEKGQDEVKAVGEFIHVFVDRESRRPGKDGMSQELKSGLEKLLTDKSKL